MSLATPGSVPRARSPSKRSSVREHEIDADVVPDLTEADLEKIGLPLGARKRPMKGISGLVSKEAPPSARAAAARRLGKLRDQSSAPGINVAAHGALLRVQT